MANMRLGIALLVAATCLSARCAAKKAAGEFTVLKDADDFEQRVIQSPDVWLVGYIYKDDTFASFARKLAASLGGAVRVGLVDFNAKTREICYEHNVRKRRCPQLRLFPTRSRTSVHIEVPDPAAVARMTAMGEDSAQGVVDAVEAALVEAGCERDGDEGGRAKKITLALGGAPGAGTSDEL